MTIAHIGLIFFFSIIGGVIGALLAFLAMFGRKAAPKIPHRWS